MIKLHESWRAPLADALASPSMAALQAFLSAEKAAGKAIFPNGREWFRALDLTPLDAVRVVILGQDPYHGPGQAHGLALVGGGAVHDASHDVRHPDVPDLTGRY